MIKLTRLDGSPLVVNTQNIQWIEVLPDTVITFLGGGRAIIKEKLEDVTKLIEEENARLTTLLNSPPKA